MKNETKNKYTVTSYTSNGAKSIHRNISNYYKACEICEAASLQVYAEVTDSRTGSVLVRSRLIPSWAINLFQR